MATARNKLATLAAAAALTFGTLIAPNAAQAADIFDVPSTMDSRAEAAAMARAIEDALRLTKPTSSPTVVSFTPRVTDASVPASSTSLRASFPLPAGCSPASEQLAVNCDWGKLALAPTAVRIDGTPVAFTSAILDGRLQITAAADALDSGAYVFGLYGSPIDDQASAREAAGFLSSTLSLAVEISEGTIQPSRVEEGSTDYTRSTARFADLTAAAALPYIGVPTNYVYCATHTTAACKPATLHDYCSYSANGFRAANFRGPCARHDLAIDGIRKQNISLASKKSKRTDADVLFLAHLLINCGYANPNNDAERTACIVVANGYKAAVSFATANWNGK